MFTNKQERFGVKFGVEFGRKILSIQPCRNSDTSYIIESKTHYLCKSTYIYVIKES